MNKENDEPNEDKPNVYNFVSIICRVAHIHVIVQYGEVVGRGCISPLRSKLNPNVDETKDRPIRYHNRKADETSESLYNAIAPNQGNKLKRMSDQPPLTKGDDDLLSDSTLYQVFNACETSKRKRLNGLDNIAVDGTTAFDNILSLISKVSKTKDWKSKVRSILLSSRLYLKTDYKLHLNREDECAFHCLQYSLSDPKVGALSVGCEHLHLKSYDSYLLL
ncbi:unnamed protein product [Mytilus coruscus]|uniref:Uncharacterized protein n=1 Tax=Mytilus coruscus TaxID=42192 RepID=A0A6J8C9I2_MYTCO|nr:unnamed protein product [Mytilus coruscus]